MMADEVLAVDRGRGDAPGTELVASHQRAAHPAVGPPTNPHTHTHTILSEFKIWTSGDGSQTSCLQRPCPPVYQLAWSRYLVAYPQHRVKFANPSGSSDGRAGKDHMKRWDEQIK